MNTEKIVKESKVMMVLALILGVGILITGVIFGLMDINIVPGKAIIGLSFIPLSVASMYYYKYSTIKKSPQKMKNIIISENDERLKSLRNEANANAYKILQGMLFLSYMGYTLMVPDDIFEAVGWWILLGLLLVSFTTQGVLLVRAMGKSNPKDD